MYPVRGAGLFPAANPLFKLTPFARLGYFLDIHWDFQDELTGLSQLWAGETPPLLGCHDLLQPWILYRDYHYSKNIAPEGRGWAGPLLHSNRVSTDY